MTDTPRSQLVAALVAITLVIVVTLGVVLANQSDDTSKAATSEAANATPTPVPILDIPRQAWGALVPTLRGAADSTQPVPCPLVDERSRQPNNFLSLTPALTFICDEPGLSAAPIASGRVVMIVRQKPLTSFQASLLADGQDGPWARAATYGPFVAVDHGPRDQAANVTTIYAGLESIEPSLRLGQLVDASTPLGRLGRRQINDEIVNGVLSFELLADDTRFGSDPLRAAPPAASASAGLATALTPTITLPVTTCTLPFGAPDLLVGAPRDYRSGTHNGLDFNCGSTRHDVTAAAGGEVLFVVNDYVDATLDERNAVLASAALAIDTPFWTLAMLYGNFVVVAHDVPGVDGRAVTIYAHLSTVDENIATGLLLDRGDFIGRVGNRGTSAAAAGFIEDDPSIHLHWELHVNDRPVGYLQDPAETDPLYQQMLCSAVNPTDGPVC